jgi:hypothetical protein
MDGIAPGPAADVQRATGFHGKRALERRPPCLAHRPHPSCPSPTSIHDRRYLASSERAYAVGFEDGRFYADGWRINGEMGGVWTPPLKLVDGVWFGIGDE